MRIVTFLTLAAALAAPGGPALARYGSPPAEAAPLDRVVANLEAALAADPKDLEARLNLARAHAQAFALAATEIHVKQGTSEPRNPGGMSDRGIPEQVKNPGSGADDPQLARAIEQYRALLAVEPAHELGRLGLGWCLLQAGQKEEAAKVLRALEAEAYARDSASGHDGPPIVMAHEAGQYLLDCLDPASDADEIATLKEHQKTLQELQTWKSPILVPLADAVSLDGLVAPRASVRFDVDGDARPGTWSWITPDAAWLVWLPSPGGEIANGRQLMGERTFDLIWRDGYHALAALDDDRSGALEGSELDGLGLWRDVDGDGRATAGEVQTLEAAGLVRLECRGTRNARRDVLAWSPSGATFAGGAVRPTWDVLLKFTPDVRRIASGAGSR